ncbi:MAG: 1-acyl-sn-glycerol-3-phosphate acyltransferase, partial [Candidatus Omnitrophica bacterium]|nr:1-acyl-sn-glycerol-3-phosphate acyltransferase [Candidatus Omnitrophota bacterium]
MTVYRASQAFFRLIFRLYFRWEVRGTEHLTCAGGGLLVCNHTSFLDPPLAGTPWPRPIHYLAREDLFRVPVLGWWMRACRTIPVKRGPGSLYSLRRVIHVIQRGGVVLMFPEGTRSATGELQDARGGVGFIVKMTGAPVFPCYIAGAFEAWPRHAWVPRPRKIRVTYGPPVTLPADLPSEELSRRALALVEAGGPGGAPA